MMMPITLTVWTQYFMLSVMILLSVAFFSLMERKVLSLIHFRFGPNKVVYLGLLQPIADALKLITKNDSSSHWSDYTMFYVSPILSFAVALGTWVVFPFTFGSSLKLSVITLMIFIGIMVYSILIPGWSSNSKYALLGSMRSVSQALSYEVVSSFLVLTIINVMSTYTLWNFKDMPDSYLFIMLPPLFMCFIICTLAELNRTPFDLSEGESELVSGYSVEYGGIMYTLLFLSENVMIFVSSFMMAYLFFVKSVTWLPLIWSLWSLVICVIRGALPRFRYDLLMTLCWLSILPLALLGLGVTLVMTPQ